MGLFLGLILALPAFFASPALADSKTDSQKQFERAVKMRTMLEGYLEKDRGESDYKQTVLAYHKVYLITPEAPDATSALVAEAELYQSMGRLFDPKYFQEALGRYNFLLKQYPGTRYRAETLFAIGKIQQNDLKKSDDARETFKQFLKRYPHSDKAADAQQALKELAESRQPGAKQSVAPVQNHTDQAESQQKSTTKDAAQQPADTAETKPDAKADTKLAAKTDPTPKARKADQQKAGNVNVSDSQPDLKGQAVEPRVGDRISNVTRVQTWNSPGSTRVIVTLNDTIKYESARIASPDRIYFNLYKAKVGPKLSREALDVDDGLLESVRVAQNKPDVVRLVLNVNGDRDYSAFLLANPYRLVIDVHSRAVSTAKSSSTPAATSAAASTGPASNTVASNAMASNAASSTGIASTAVPAPTVAAQPVAPPSFAPDIPSPKATKASKVLAPPTAVPAVNDAKSGPASVPVAAERATEKSDNAAPDLPTSKAAAHADQSSIKVAEKTILPLSKKTGKTTASLEPPAEAKPTRDGQRSLARALGLKISRIVIDAGHGGHDTGTIGPHGLMEKDLCLDVALRLGSLIEQKLPGADVVYTRNDDTFIPLEERTAIANRAQADLFLSIHANSSHDGTARGVETYYLNFATTQESMEVASRENALSQESLHDLQDLIKKIAANDKIEESKELASDVQDSLTQRLQLVSHGERNRGVKKAPFVVLIGANMPSVLSEISFVSNPNDEKLLRKGEQRQRIADGLFRGVSSYLESLNSISNNKQKLVSANPAEPGTLASNGNPK
jgi:N-acetylmuramoyl-L-alanine amidase